MSNPVSSVFIIGGPTPQSGPIGKDTPKVVQTVPTAIPHAATKSTVDEAAVVRVEEVDIPNLVHVSVCDDHLKDCVESKAPPLLRYARKCTPAFRKQHKISGDRVTHPPNALESTEPIMTLSDYNIVPTKPLDDGDGLGIGGYAQYPQCPDPSKDVRGRAGLVDNGVSENSSALMPKQQSGVSDSDLIHTTRRTLYHAEVEQGARSDNEGIDMEQVGQDEITKFLQEKRRLAERLGGEGEDMSREDMSIRPPPEPPPRRVGIRLQPTTSSARASYYITDGGEYSMQTCDDDLEVTHRRSEPETVVMAQGADDLFMVPTRIQLTPPSIPVLHRRRWKNVGKLRRKRSRARKRKKRKEYMLKKDNVGTVWLRGVPEEPRLSFQYRVRPVGSNTYVTIGAVLAFVNVRTLRQKRKVGYSGTFKTKATKNNWKIPALISLMRQKGIYMIGLSETRRPSGMKEVGNGYLLITSQNGKYSWLGGTGFLLSPSAALAFKAAGCRTWTPPMDSVVSGRYLEIGLAAATKKEGIITFASVYAPTAQSTLEVRHAFWSVIEDRMMTGDFNNRHQNQGGHHRRRRPTRRIYVAMGDWNAQVGRKTVGDPHNGVLGLHNFERRNANGSMMLETMMRCGMRIANTYFQHDYNHTGTWTNPSSKVKRVIDHAVVRA